MLHNTFVPTFIVDISEEIDKKMETIKSYRSQFYINEEWKESTYINNPEFVNSIRIRSQFYGGQIGCQHGEPYYFEGILKIDNIMKFFT